jgi:hypothetical protein
MIQNGDGNCDQMVEQLRLQVDEAAAVLSRKKISLAGQELFASRTLWLCPAPCIVSRYPLPPPYKWVVSRDPSGRSLQRRHIYITAAHTHVLFGGYMGYGWKKWSDEAGIERLRILQLAWQEHDTVFGKAM